MAAQNCAPLSVNVLKTSADSGMRTIRLRYSSVYPSVRLKPGKTFLLPPRDGPAAPPGSGTPRLATVIYLTV
jgi:hypothetical protein